MHLLPRSPVPALFAALTVAAAATAAPANASSAWFADVTAEAGLDFEYVNGAEGRFWFPEIMGGGAALLDYDGDGRLDLYLVQGGRFGPEATPADRSHGDRLYRNVTEPGGPIRLADVTGEAGIDARGYGQGVAAADYDGDGDTDLYVLNVGPNQLWRNNGDGTFSDVTETAGVGDPRWSVSASFADVTGDGRLDLLVVNYVDWSFEGHRDCRAAGSSRLDYCSPSAYPPAPDALFVNLGDGTFRDASDAVGLSGAAQPGLGAVAADFDDNGRVDLYVANDGTPNQYWLNPGDGRWVDEAFLAGNAVNASGAAEAGMGVDAGDHDRDGDLDLFVTHLVRETNTLYRNDGQGWFTDATASSGLGPPSLPKTGFGTAFVDFDRDGRLDLFVANGGVVSDGEDDGPPVEGDRSWPYHQTDQLFAGGDDRFRDATAGAGPALQVERTGRGAAFGDLDNDGRVDVVVANNRGAAQLLHNVTDAGPRWIGVDLRDADGGRDALPASVRVISPDGLTLAARARSDGSYASANDPRAVLALGEHAGPVELEVRWPDGQRERFAGLEVDVYHELVRGQGAPPPSAEE
ncbi:CRTAC1 family protein [Halomonas denitrificans]|nr:CRTAC1 family protein [Halomonas denitrificans]